MSMSIDTYKEYQLQKENVKHHNAFEVQASGPFFGTILSETHNFSSFNISDVLLSQSILPNLPITCALHEISPGIFLNQFNQFIL